MYKVKVLTYWEVVDGANTPKITLQSGDSWMDITGQQNIMPNPNSVVLEVWTQDFTPYENDIEIEVLSIEEVIQDVI